MFKEVAVVDYITDYSSLTADQKNRLIADNKIINSRFLKNCPNGTIIAVPIEENPSLQKKVYYPFFSHISMPIKAGERAWVFEQQPGLAPYWLTRKVQNETAEDLNFTHDPRADLYNGLAATNQDASRLNSSTFYDPNSSGVVLKQARSNAISRSEFIGEPVVSIKSKSVDLTLQGSNGTVISMTTGEDQGTGTIDLVAGPADISNLADQQTIQNSDRYRETIKPPASPIGQLSSNDESRIIVSRNFNADEYYALTGSNSGESPTISLSTDSVRIQARKDMKIVVGSSADPSSIILKSNGDIIITPSSLGIIKLGGEDATGAILASVDSVVTAGKVVAPSLVSTAGGILGAPDLPATGIFSTKVLVRVN